MFSFYSIKFVVAVALVFSLCTSCRFCRKAENGTSDRAPFLPEELKSEIPFATKEPEVFQVEIVVSAGSEQRKTFIARNGARRRYDFAFGTENQLTSLETDKNYLILPGKKIYAENLSGENSPISENWTDFLTTEWLNEKHGAVFERLETTENLTRYRVKSSSNLSEILVFIDEKIGLPVKQEFYNVNGEQKTLIFSVELKNFKSQAEDDLFALPVDYRKVQPEELRKILRNEEKAVTRP